MPRFYFHVYDDDVALDDEGMEVASAASAMEIAVTGARALACEEVSSGRLHLSHRIEVADEKGAIVGKVTYRDAVTVEE